MCRDHPLVCEYQKTEVRKEKRRDVSEWHKEISKARVKLLRVTKKVEGQKQEF